MPKKDDDFLKKLLAIFKIEAQEHLKTMSSGLLELEKSPGVERQRELIETIFREAHSLKGASRSVNMREIEMICQSMETVLARLKRNEITLSSELFDLFHDAVNNLEGLLSAFESGQNADAKLKTGGLTRRLEAALNAASFPPRKVEPQKVEIKQPVLPGKPSLAETVRIPAAKLNSVLLQAEELLSAKLTTNHRARELREINTLLAVRRKEWAKIHPVLRAIKQSSESNGRQNGHVIIDPQIVRLLEFLEWDKTFVQSLENKLTALTLSADHDQRSLAGMVDNLLEDTKRTLMLPFSSLLEIFPKLARDLSRDQGKDVELVIQGTEIEIDRRILDEMKDPLIHLVRNAIDHGIEKPMQREQKHKSPRGMIRIAIYQKDGGKVEILIADDGVGIDVAKVKAAARKLGFVSPEESDKLREQEILTLIFQSGVSTSPIITDLSGRGLGLAIVREKVEKLGGVITVETRPGIGTTFRMVLPMTLATYRGILVRADEHLFVIRTTNVECVVRINKEEIKTVENRETIPFNGQAVSLVRLADVLGLTRRNSIGGSEEKVYAIVLGSAEKRIAFLVDEVLGEQEVLVKGLGSQLSRVRHITGATVLGTGKVLPILNIHDLMKSAVKGNAAPVGSSVAAENVKTKRKSILVAEDSITARTLVKNILESVGYHVKTAVDGVDAFTALRMEEFDLVVSDVDMPRMSGLDLTVKIRSDKKLADLPVVLVTALGSREDRERGIDVGANAYIVKSNFDQSDLLDVIRRLI